MLQRLARVSITYRVMGSNSWLLNNIFGTRTYDFPIENPNIPIDYNEFRFKAHCKLSEEFKIINGDCQILECWPRAIETTNVSHD